MSELKYNWRMYFDLLYVPLPIESKRIIMGDSLSWARDQEREAEQRREEAYKKSEKYLKKEKNKQSYISLIEILNQARLADITLGELKFIQEDIGGVRYGNHDQAEEKFFTDERINRLTEILRRIEN